MPIPNKDLKCTLFTSARCKLLSRRDMEKASVTLTLLEARYLRKLLLGGTSGSFRPDI